MINDNNVILVHLSNKYMDMPHLSPNILPRITPALHPHYPRITSHYTSITPPLPPHHINTGVIPTSWLRYNVPSGITVIQWVTDFASRIKQLQDISQTSSTGGASILKVCIPFVY